MTDQIEALEARIAALEAAWQERQALLDRLLADYGQLLQQVSV